MVVCSLELNKKPGTFAARPKGEYATEELPRIGAFATVSAILKSDDGVVGRRPRIRLRPSFAVILCGFSAVAGQATEAGKHLVALSDLESVGLHDVTMQLSPNGRKLAYALGSDSVWVVNTLGGVRASKIGQGFLPTWSPSGDRIAFYSLGPEGVQLSIYEPKTRRSTRVTQVEGGIDPDPTTRVVGWVHDAFRYSWSPDGKRLVFASRVPAPTINPASATAIGRGSEELAQPGAPLILTPTTPPEWTLSGVFAHAFSNVELMESKDGHSLTVKANVAPGAVHINQLFVVDLAKRRIERLTNDNVSYFNPSWSPNGQEILVASSDQAGPIWGAQSINLYAVNTQSGTRRQLTNGVGVRSRPSWSPDGLRVAYLGSHALVNRNYIFLGDAAGDTFRNVTSQLDRQVSDYQWSADGNSILITYRDGVSTRLGLLDLSSGVVARVAPRVTNVPVSVSAPSVSRSGAVAWVQSDPTSAGTVWYATSSHSKVRPLVDVFPQMREWNLGDVEIVRWRNSRGDDLEGTLLKPPGYTLGKRYPLIVDAYPLAGGSSWTHPMFGNQAWASMQYVVFVPSPRAPNAWINPWKSEASSLAGKGPQGWNVAFDDVMSGVDSLIEKGIADPDRMCLYGFSSGSAVVNYLISRTDRFKCAVSVAPAGSDWIRRVLLETNVSWVSKWAGVSLWNDPAAYIELSGVFRTHLINTPVLLAAGDDDGEFLLDAIEMYNGLRVAGKEVTLLRYPNQGHGFSGAALEDFWQREMAFMANYLRP